MEQPDIIRKRFIAGAVCPQCDVVDRIVVEVVLEQVSAAELSRRRCVACGFADEFGQAPRTGTAGVPRGRPERPRAAAVQASVVRIMLPGEDRAD